MRIEYTILQAPVGTVLTAQAKEGLVFVGLGDDALEQVTAFAKKRFPGASIVPSISEAAIQMQQYIDGERKRFDLKVYLKGTDFQKRVWKALAKIPFGKTSTYGEVAKNLRPSSIARAVGQACGANPIPLVVPCHRVLGYKGLGGYAYGLEWKEWLLKLEGVSD